MTAGELVDDWAVLGICDNLSEALSYFEARAHRCVTSDGVQLRHGDLSDTTKFLRELIVLLQCQQAHDRAKWKGV